MPQYLTAVEIAKLTGWSVGYVRNLASRYGWRRLGTRPQRYAVEDVVACRVDSPDLRK